MNPVLNVIGSMMGGGNPVGSAGGMQQGKGNPLAGIMSIYGMLKGTSDPMSAIQSMAQTNPQVKKAMDIVNQNGGDMQTAFYALAKQMGVNPDEIFNMVRQG